ncbi:unnamed protein product [Caretta caretta]
MVFSFQYKLKLLKRDSVKRRVNTFPEIEVENHKLEEYRGILQGLLDDFQTRFEDLQKLRSCFAFLVNPFVVDVIDGCLIPKTVVMETSTVEMELLELQEDQAVKMMHKSQSTIKFWKQVPRMKYPQLKKSRM